MHERIEKASLIHIVYVRKRTVFQIITELSNFFTMSIAIADPPLLCIDIQRKPHRFVNDKVHDLEAEKEARKALFSS